MKCSEILRDVSSLIKSPLSLNFVEQAKQHKRLQHTHSDIQQHIHQHVNMHQ